MDSENRRPDDVDFFDAEHPGNEKFRDFIRWLIADGSYNPIFDSEKKKEVVDIVQDYMAGFDPPARFLQIKRLKKEKGLSTFVAMSQEKIFQNVLNSLSDAWNDWIESPEAKKMERKHFNRLIQSLAKDFGHDADLEKQVTTELIGTIQEFMKQRFPNGSIQQLSNTEITSTVRNRFKLEQRKLVSKRMAYERSMNEWASWLNKKNGDPDQKPASCCSESITTNGKTVGQESVKSEFVSTTEQQTMERRYPKGTKIEMIFKGEVVGYSPPNYLIHYGGDFQETFDEDDMKRYAISATGNIVPMEQRSSAQATDQATEQTADQTAGAPVVEESVDSATKNATEERFRRMDLEIAQQKVEMERIKKELADFRSVNSSSSRQHKEEELQSSNSSNERTSAPVVSPQRKENVAPNQAVVSPSPVRTLPRVSNTRGDKQRQKKRRKASKYSGGKYLTPRQRKAIDGKHSAGKYSTPRQRKALELNIKKETK